MNNEKVLNINEEEMNKEDKIVEVKEKKTSKSKKTKDEAKEKKTTAQKTSIKKTATSKKTSEEKKSTAKKGTTKKSTTKKNSTTKKTTTPKKTTTKKKTTAQKSSESEKESNIDEIIQEKNFLETPNEENLKTEINESVEIDEKEDAEQKIEEENTESEVNKEDEEKQNELQEKINEKLKKMQDLLNVDIQTVKQNIIEIAKQEKIEEQENFKKAKNEIKNENQNNLQENKLRGVSLVWLITMITVIVVFFNSSYNIYKIIIDYQKIEEENNELVDNFTYIENISKDNETTSENKDLENDKSSKNDKVDGFKVRWDEIKKMNQDVCAWIIIPGTSINYPVLKSDISDKYLKTNVYGKHSNGGSIFIDSNTIQPFDTNNTIIYGHNLNNGEMFSDLKNFKDENFAKENSKIKVVMEDNTMKTYQIFAFYEIASDNFDVYNTNVLNLDAYYELIKNNNTINVTEKIDTTKQIITLSTCTNYNEGTRFIVQAFCED